jgi:hypothetical protein
MNECGPGRGKHHGVRLAARPSWLGTMFLQSGSLWTSRRLAFDRRLAPFARCIAAPANEVRVSRRRLVLRVLLARPHECVTGKRVRLRLTRDRSAWPNPSDRVEARAKRGHAREVVRVTRCKHSRRGIRLDSGF